MTSNFTNELRYGYRSLVRENPYARHRVTQLRFNEHRSPEALREMGQQLLFRTLQRAIGTLPAYRHISRDFSPAQSVQVLREAFPIIDKHALLARRGDFFPMAGRAMPWQSVGQTSGTTGTPLSIVRSLDSVLMENAFIRRHWEWSGYNNSHNRATLRGDLVVGLDRQVPPFWFWNRYDKQLLISARHLNDRCVDAIIEQIERLQPYILQAYPSTAYTLSTLMMQRNRTLAIPYIYTASEPLYPHQRECITKRLGGRIMDMYGMAERVAFATECEYGEMHVNPDYSHVDIVDESGRPTSETGFIVGTTYHNLAMPLVQYRTSDRTRWKPGQCRCGRHFPMIEPVTGKYEDAITGAGGKAISPSVLTFAFKGVEHIRKSQVAQVGPERWEIRLVPAPEFGEQDKRKLLSNVRQLVDAVVHVEVVLKEDLPNTAAGKFRWVVNESKQSV
jgi:phenylacetate-CoA ligase